MNAGVRSQESGVRIAALSLLVGSVCFGAIDPVSWTLSSDALRAAPGATVPLQLTSKIDEGWHIYSVATPAPRNVKITIGDSAVHVFQPKPEQKFDEVLGEKVEFYEKEAVFWVPF